MVLSRDLVSREGILLLAAEFVLAKSSGKFRITHIARISQSPCTLGGTKNRSKNMSRILIVDDEEHVLNALRRLLSLAARQLKIDLFSAPEEA